MWVQSSEPFLRISTHDTERTGHLDVQWELLIFIRHLGCLTYSRGLCLPTRASLLHHPQLSEGGSEPRQRADWPVSSSGCTKYLHTGSALKVKSYLWSLGPLRSKPTQDPWVGPWDQSEPWSEASLHAGHRCQRQNFKMSMWSIISCYYHPTIAERKRLLNIIHKITFSKEIWIIT